MKNIIFTWILLLLNYTGFSQQTCNQTFNVTGTDTQPTVLSISPTYISCNAGIPITNITLNSTTNFSDAECDNWYNFTLQVDSGTPVTGCRSDFDGTDITGFSNLTITSNNTNSIENDIVTIEVKLTVTYAACPAPFNLAASNITASGVDLGWDSVNEATSGYDWRIMEDGDDPDVDTPVDSANGVTGTSISASGLSDDKPYDAYVRSNCGGGISSWSSKVDFRTDCVAESIPYTEDFESGSVDYCWSRTDTGESFISSNCGSNTSSFLQINGGTHTTETNIIDVSGETSIDVSYKIYNGCNFLSLAETENLAVDYWDGNAWQNIVTYKPVNIASSWTPEKFTITSGLTADFKLRFDRSGGSSGFDDLDIDDLVVEATPSCLVPTGLATSNVTATSVDLDWNSEAIATNGYDWVIMADEDDPNVGTPVDSANGVAGTSVSSSVVLSSNTNYDAYVRGDCGGGDKSDWSSVGSFTTLPDYCGGDNFFDNGGASGNYSDSTLETTVISPDNPGNVVTVTFLSFNIESGFFSDELKIYDGPDNSATLLGVFNGTTNPGSFTSTHPSGALTFVFDSDFIVNRPGWEATISCAPPPSCVAPTGLTSSNVTATSVDLDWNSVYTATSGYDWRIMEDGDDPDVDTPADSTNGVTGTSVSVSSGLSANTTYDPYVRSDCGGGDKSGWSSAESFTTLCTAVTSFPYTESFTMFLNNCWEENLGSASNPSSTGTSNTNWTDGTFNGDDSAKLRLLYDTTAHWLITEDFDLGSNTDYQLALGIAATEHNYSSNYANFSFQDEVGLAISTDDGATWTSLGTYTQGSTPSNTGQTDIYDLSSYTGVVKFGIYGIASPNPALDPGTSYISDHDVYITEFTIEEVPSCPVPTGLDASNVTAISVVLDWIGTATSAYDWVIMADGDDPDVDTPVDFANGVTGTSVNVFSGLLNGTTYNAYVRSDCGGGDKSDWSSVESFSTQPSNDDACDAIALTLGASSTGNQYTNLGASAQTNEPDTNLADGVNSSVWFTFVAPTYGNVQVTTDIAGGSLTDTEIAVYSTAFCSDFTTYDQIGFDQNGGSTVNSNSVLNLYHLTAGDTYYIQVDRFDFFGTLSGGTFGIEVRDLSYVYNGTTWSPQVPGGNATDVNNLIVESGTVPIATATTANEVIVEAGAVLDLNADLTADVTFHSDISGTAQLADATGNSITGDVTVERFIPVQTESTRAFRFLTSAVDSTDPIFDNWQESGNSPAGFGTHISGNNDGTNGIDQTATGNPSMYTFDNTFTGNQSNAWEAVTDTKASNLVAGEAYRMFIRGDRNYNLNAIPGDSDYGPNTDVTLRATGDLVIGNYTHTLSDVGGYYSLVGNPYQAVVDFNNLITNNVNIVNYYVWDPNMSSRGAYVTHNLNSGLNDLVSSAANEFIMPGQSFFVRTVNDGTASLEFTEIAKDVNAGQTTVFSDDDPSYINLLLYKNQDLINGDSESDGIVILFDDNGNNDVDDNDATKLGNPDENLARFNNGRYLSIEERAKPMDTEILELYTAGYSVSDYTFSLTNNNIEDGLTIYLIDNYTGDISLMNGNENTYSFSVDPNAPESIATDRFSIEFKIETFNVNDNEIASDFDLYPNPVSDGVVTLRSQAMAGDEVRLRLYNIIGQRVLETEQAFEADGELKLEIGSPQAGVYFLEIHHQGDTTKERLIIK